jgi:hypothetical protein
MTNSRSNSALKAIKKSNRIQQNCINFHHQKPTDFHFIISQFLISDGDHFSKCALLLFQFKYSPAPIIKKKKNI